MDTQGPRGMFSFIALLVLDLTTLLVQQMHWPIGLYCEGRSRQV